MESNILLLCPSLYIKDRPEMTYTSAYYVPEYTVTTRHTNIPVFSMLSRYLKKEGQKIDHVIMLSSHEVCQDIKATEFGEMTTLQYLQKQFTQVAGHPLECSVIEIDSNEITDTAKLQSIIDHRLSALNVSKANIWVDYTSGLRSYAILLVFLLRYFETQRRYAVRDILYANISGGKGSNTIDSCHAVYRLFGQYERLAEVSPRTQKNESSSIKAESERMTPAEMALTELAKLNAKLGSDLRNAAGDRSDEIQKTRDRVLEIKEQYADNLNIADMADSMLRTLPDKIDSLTQVEYLIEHDSVSHAMTRLKETAFRYLEKEGIVITNNIGIDKIEVEVISSTFYYESCLSFMGSLLRELHNSDRDPLYAFDEAVDKALEVRYDAREYRSYQKRPAMHDKVKKDYASICSSAIRRKDTAFMTELRKLVGANSDTEDTGAILRLLQEYQNKSMQYEQLYLQSGFPMACMDYQRAAFDYKLCRRELMKKARRLMSALRSVKNKAVTADARALFGELLEQDADYEHILTATEENLPKLLPLTYSFECFEGQWRCGLQDKALLRDFFNTYLPLHNSLRKLRNSFSHAKNSKELSNEQKEQLTRESLTMLRALSAQKRNKLTK